MCTGVEIAALFSAVASSATAVSALTAPTPKDPAKLQAQADAKAAQSANSRLALRNKALTSNSLLTGAPTDGKTTFGG